MNIGIDIRTLMEGEYSGVPEYTFNLVNKILEVDKKNHYKLFYNSSRNIKDRLPLWTGENVEIVGTRYPNKIFNLLLQSILKRPKLDKLLGVDIFFTPNPGFLALSPECRKITTVHDLSFWRYPKFFSLKRRIWHKLIGVKKLIENSDKIIAVSKSTKNDIIDYCGLDEKKIEVIYSGISREFRKINSYNFRFDKIKYKYSLPDKFILFLGTIEPRKNICGLVSAFNDLLDKRSDLRSYYLVIAGGNGWNNKEIFKAIKKSKYRDNIKYIGFVEKKDKVYIFNLAKVFVYPSFYEGFGFPPLEAAACGIPVISGANSSVNEVMGGAALYVNPLKTDEISRSIELLLCSKALRDRYIKAGLKVSKKYRWEDSAGRFIELLSKIYPA